MAIRLQKHGYEAYIVGGGVRDLLLGKQPKDFDVATSARPEEVRALFRNSRLIGRRFRLAHICFNQEIIEVATFRGESKSPGDDHHTDRGRIVRDNVWGSLEEDAWRRDFTVNALFLDPAELDILDYVGGYDDLMAGRLKLIGKPVQRYREDPVRLLRAIRFMAKLDLEIDSGSGKPLSRMGALLHDVPPARLYEEVNKLFLTGHAVRSFALLRRFELLQIMFPGMPDEALESGAAAMPLVQAGLANTDQRAAENKPLTPAFLFAILLWPNVSERFNRLTAKGTPPFQAMSHAGEQAVLQQLRVTAVPRRVSVSTRLIWSLQSRFARKRGARAERFLAEKRFRAAYDFLLLRAVEDPSLEHLAEWWTELQDLSGSERMNALYPHGRRRGRAPRKRKARQ